MPLLPRLRIHNRRVPLASQAATLKPTYTAQALAKSIKKKVHEEGFEALKTRKDILLWDNRTADREARRRAELVVAEPSKKQWMGQLLITFGQYAGASFIFLLENDVGYVKL